MSEQEQNSFEQVEEVLVKSESFLVKNLKTIVIAAGVVLVAVGGWYGYTKLIQEPRNERASAELFKAEDLFINGQDSLALAGEGLTTKGMEAIIKEYSGTDAANVAQLYKGIALYDAGQYKEAIAALEQFDSKDAYVAPSAIRLIGDCYAQLEQYQDAVKAYERAAKLASNEAISPSCLIKAGHAYERLGNKEKALELYQEVQTKYIDTPEGHAVAAEIARLG